MVEPVTLGVIVAALVAKALDRAEDEAVDSGVGILRRLVGTLRERFAGGRDADGTEKLERVADAPDSASRVGQLAELIDDRAAQSPELRLELEQLVKEAGDAGVDVKSIVQTATGNNNMQFADVADSVINVTQGPVPKPRD